MTVGDALRAATARLSAASDTARLDAELLMAHALGVTRSAMLIGRMQEDVPDGFEALVARRSLHEPVAHIVGHQEFYGLDLSVTPDTLIPRGDSETLVEAARKAFAGRSAPERVLDLGTGTGALLFAALSLWEEARGVGIDASEAALVVARGNGERLGMAARAEMRLANWREPDWQDGLGLFDLVLCNPPYVEEDAPLDPSVREFEPASALFSGTEGLDDYRILVPQLRGLLRPDGIAILEIGASQGDLVAQIADEAGFHARLERDLANRPRALVLT